MTDRLRGRYRMGALLGRGAFATVHEAHDEQLDDRVAVKLLAHNHAVDVDMRRRFVTEGQILRRISSPHVVAVHDLAENDDGRPFLVLELCDQGTLRERVEGLRTAGWKPTDADAAAIAMPLAAAIQALADADVVHRDLTPANILLTTSGPTVPPTFPSQVVQAGERLVVTDLGFCKDLARSTGITAAGGTSGFQPPEQRTVGEAVDTRSDIWAASAVLTWALTGETPESTGDARTALRRVGLSAALADAVAAGLAEDPDRRAASPTIWLAGILAAVPGSDGTPAASPLLAVEKRPKLRTQTVVATAAVLVLAVGMIGWLGSRSEVPDQALRPFGPDAIEVAAAATTMPSPTPTPTPTPTPPPATPTIDPDRLASGYGPPLEGEWAFHLTTHEGWEYDVVVDARAAVAFRAFEPPTAPPGMARPESATIGGAVITITPTLEGREAPQPAATIDVGFTGTDAPVNTGQCQSWQEFETGPTIALHCDIPDGEMRAEGTWSFFGDVHGELDAVEERVALWSDRAPDMFILRISPVTELCAVVLLPDGTIGRDTPGGAARSLACTISGPGTFDYDAAS